MQGISLKCYSVEEREAATGPVCLELPAIRTSKTRFGGDSSLVAIRWRRAACPVSRLRRTIRQDPCVQGRLALLAQMKEPSASCLSRAWTNIYHNASKHMGIDCHICRCLPSLGHGSAKPSSHVELSQRHSAEQRRFPLSATACQEARSLQREIEGVTNAIGAAALSPSSIPFQAGEQVRTTALGRPILWHLLLCVHE